MLGVHRVLLYFTLDRKIPKRVTSSNLRALSSIDSFVFKIKFYYQYIIIRFDVKTNVQHLR